MYVSAGSEASQKVEIVSCEVKQQQQVLDLL